MEIEKVMIPIEKIINNSEECFAHVAKDNKQKETLKEHTEPLQINSNMRCIEIYSVVGIFIRILINSNMRCCK